MQGDGYKEKDVYWCEGLQYLPQEARRRHYAKGAFYINSRHPISPSESIHELGIVSYPGSGKYKGCIFLRYDDLPETEEAADEIWRKVVSPHGQGWWPVVILRVLSKKVLVVCWYQLLRDGTVAAWWIYLDDDIEV